MSEMQVLKNPIDTNGSCDTKTKLASNVTDEAGNYSLVYNKTGGIACLTVTGQPNGIILIY